jgi:hypothetical protein
VPADVELGVQITKKGEGDKEAASGLELVARAADNAADELPSLIGSCSRPGRSMVAAGKEFAKTGDISVRSSRC